jgi:predicted DNA-binding transcriptional regulator AlpA
MTDTTSYLDEDAVADMLCISVRTVQRWRSTGDGPPFIRAGARRVIYSRGAIEGWVSARTFAHHGAKLASAEKQAV